jgi:GGDEF domain-containing protein
MHSRYLTVAVGVTSLLLGVWSAVVEEPELAVAAGVFGLSAGLLAFTSHPPATRVRGATGPAREGEQAEPRRAEGASETAGTGGNGTAASSEGTGAPEVAPPDPAGSLPEHVGLTDPETGLYSEAYLHSALDSRLAVARRHLRPVSLALLAVTEGMAEPSPTGAAATHVAAAIRGTVRESDVACRMDDGTLAVILEDTPEDGAVWTVERVRRNLVSRFGHHTIWAGVACYPTHAFHADELVEQARAALTTAREWNQDRIEVAVAE